MNLLYKKLLESDDFMTALKQIGEVYARSGFFRCTKTEQGMVLAMIGFANNWTPAQVAARYHIVDGQLSLRSVAALADFRKLGGKVTWVDQGTNGDKSVAIFTHEGKDLEGVFTIEDAKRQYLVKPDSNWVKTPANMLRARVITNTVAMMTPEVFCDGAPGDEETTTVPTDTQFNLDGTDKAKEPEKKPAQIQNEEEELANMGLAPATKPEPAPKPATKPEPQKTTSAPKSKPKAAKGKTIEPETPIPPPKAILEPEVPAAAKTTTPPAGAPQIEEEELSDDIIDQIGVIIQGHFVEVANWMIKEKWIPAADTEIQTEAKAAVYLRRTLPTLTKARAKKILAKKMAFMRAVATIEP